jgi:putative selenium metabolism protein SsnA
MTDVLLTGGTLVDPIAGRVERADLHVSGDRIGGSSAHGRREVVDVSGCLVMPGNVCAHHHMYSALARGMPPPDDSPRNFREILERVWWRLDRALDLDDIRLSALLAGVEAARAGTTTIVDHHSSPEAIDSSLDALVEGIDETGVRAALCYEVTDRHGEARGSAGVEENARFLRSNDKRLVRGMVGAHASFTIGPRTMDALVSVARDAGAPVHIHVAEDDCDQQDSLEKYGLRTIHRLQKAGALGEGDVIAHGVHLDPEELELVRSSGTWIAHNPRSNMNNGVGYAPVREMGERVALGTDGIDGDMFAEARTCYLRAREASWEAGPAFALDRLATGAALAGSIFGEPSFGRLEPGAPADLVVLEYHSPTSLDETNIAAHLCFGFGSSMVRDVMVAGRWIVRDRKHELVDESELADRCRAAAEALWSRMRDF